MMNIQKRITFLLFILLSAAFLVSCGSTDGTRVSTNGQTGLMADEMNVADDLGDTESKAEDSRQVAEELYAVISMNTKNNTLRLYDCKKNRQEDYTYNDATYFMDKYGKITSASQIVPGRIVQLEVYRKTGELRTVQVSDEAWIYEDIKRYSVEPDENILRIADTKYYYEDDLHVFSDDKMISIKELGENDILRVQGIGRKIMTISVTSGHGTIRLTNTDLFEGGWMSLSSKMYFQVTKDMQIEVAEGNYVLSVANDGYGDSKEITVERGEETVVDLDELKGEGPKFCTVTFEVGVENAVMTLDGEVIDYNEPQQIKYGIHRLEIVAEGYETWSRRLYVNSKEATIKVAMTSDGSTPAGDDTSTEKDSSTEKDTSSENSGSDNKSTEKSNQDTEKENTQQEENSTETNKAGSQTGSKAGSQAGSKAGSQAGSKAGSQAGSTADSESGSKKNDSTEKSSTEKSSEEKESTETKSDNSNNDFLKTLSEILDTLTGGSSGSD